jgi:hypothetical protein
MANIENVAIDDDCPESLVRHVFGFGWGTAPSKLGA